MAALDVSILLSLVDRASAPAAAALGRIRGGAGEVATAGRAGVAATNALAAGARRLVAAAGAWVSIKGTVGAAMEFETALSEIEKVSGLSGEALKRQGERIIGLSRTMPVAAGELARLTAASYQYGIAASDIERFTLLGAKASVAFGIAAGETGESLAKLKASFGLSIEEVERLADAINYTADTTATSEANVIDYLMRVGATAKQYGIAANEAAAFGATMSSIGIESARGATAFNAVTAKLAGLTKNKAAVKALDSLGGRGYAASLQKAFFERPTKALIEFFRATRSMDKATRAGFLIDFFGLEYQDDAAAISENLDQVIAKMEELDDAGRYVGSVDRTFKAFSATTVNRLKVLGNILTSWGIGLGEKVIGPISDMAEWLNDTLNNLGRHATVFDRIGIAFRGFLDGLGATDGSPMRMAIDGLLASLRSLRDFVFGEKGADAGLELGRIFLKFRAYGETLRPFAEGLATAGRAVIDFIDAVGQLFGMDPGEAGGMVATMGSWGAQLAVAAVGFAVMATAVRGLTSAILALSGLKAAAGALAWLGRTGAGLIGGGGGRPPPPPTPPAPKPPAPRPGAANGPWRPWSNPNVPKGVGLQPIGQWSIGGAIKGLFSKGAVKGIGIPALVSWLGEWGIKEGIKALPHPDMPEGYDPEEQSAMTTLDLIQRLWRDFKPEADVESDDDREKRIQAARGDTPEERRQRQRQALGFGDSSGGTVRTEPTGVQDVRLTNPPQPANVTVNVYATTGASPEAIGAAVAGEVAGQLGRRGDADLRDAGGGW